MFASRGFVLCAGWRNKWLQRFPKLQSPLTPPGPGLFNLRGSYWLRFALQQNTFGCQAVGYFAMTSGLRSLSSMYI